MKLPEELMFLKNGKLPQKTTNESMNGKRTIISGSTSGVGLEALRRIAKAGSDIVMVVRNQAKAEPIKHEIETEFNVKVDIVLADFSDLESVREAAAIINQYDKIDCLINSVGIHSTKKKFNKDGVELCFMVNHLSQFLFTMLLKDKIIESKGRIIQINSEGHRFGGLRVNNVNFNRRIYTGLLGYGQSKTAQLMTVWELSDMLEGTGATINAMHPGAVKSNIGSNNGFLYRWWLKHVTGLMLKDASISGEAIYYLAASKEMENKSGKFYNLTIEEVPARHALNREVGKQVWALSMQMTGLDVSK